MMETDTSAEHQRQAEIAYIRGEINRLLVLLDEPTLDIGRRTRYDSELAGLVTLLMTKNMQVSQEKREYTMNNLVRHSLAASGVPEQAHIREIAVINHDIETAYIDLRQVAEPQARAGREAAIQGEITFGMLEMLATMKGPVSLELIHSFFSPKTPSEALEENERADMGRRMDQALTDLMNSGMVTASSSLADEPLAVYQLNPLVQALDTHKLLESISKHSGTHKLLADELFEDLFGPGGF